MASFKVEIMIANKAQNIKASNKEATVVFKQNMP